MNSKKDKGSGIKERARSNVSVQSGCLNNCEYCYAEAMAIRFKRETLDNREEIELRLNAIDKEYRKKEARIMFPGSHDITPENRAECLIALKKLLSDGNSMLIVSKPDPDGIRTHAILRLYSRTDTGLPSDLKASQPERNPNANTD